MLLLQTHVLTDSRRMIVKRRQWTLRDYGAYFRAGLIVLDDILSADFVRFNIQDVFNFLVNVCSLIDGSHILLQLFAPIVNDDHWWCYVVNCKEKKLYVLDSIGHSNKSRRKIDNAVVRLQYCDIGFVQVITYYQFVNLMGRYYSDTVGS